MIKTSYYFFIWTFILVTSQQRVITMPCLQFIKSFLFVFLESRKKSLEKIGIIQPSWHRMTERTSFSTSSNESQERIFSIDDNIEETVVKTYFHKRLNAEKMKRRKEHVILHDKINELQQQFDSTEREEMCKMYLQRNDKCLYLEEEKKSRDLFVKEILKLLKNRTEELRLLKNSTLKTPPAATSPHAKKEVKNMFSDDSKTDFEEEDKKKRKNSGTLNST